MIFEKVPYDIYHFICIKGDHGTEWIDIDWRKVSYWMVRISSDDERRNCVERIEAFLNRNK